MSDRATGRTNDERDLSERLLLRDESALAEIYDCYCPFVFSLAVRLTRNRQAAEDVVQDVFARLWKQGAAFDANRGTLRSWLGMLTHSASVQWVRSETAERRRAQRQSSAAIAPQASVEEVAVAEVMAEHVRDALNSLSPKLRQAIELAYFEALTYRQVGQAIGIPEGTVKSRMRLALEQLGRRLDAGNFDPAYPGLVG